MVVVKKRTANGFGENEVSFFFEPPSELVFSTRFIKIVLLDHNLSKSTLVLIHMQISPVFQRRRFFCWHENFIFGGSLRTKLLGTRAVKNGKFEGRLVASDFGAWKGAEEMGGT